jgi:hypothetical protein
LGFAFILICFAMSPLSLHTPWVESPFLETELRAARLTPEQETLVRTYARQGYLLLDPGLDETLLDEARARLEPEYAAGGTNRLQDAWQRHPAVRQIAAAPKVLEVLRLLYRREPIPFQTLNFATGSQQRTHSDSIHFHSVPERFMCGVWVALEDVHADNGPLHYYPGSHKLPTYDLSILGLQGSTSGSTADMLARHYGRYEDFIAALVAEHGLPKQTLHLKKGQALIWSANLLHGGEPIRQPGSTRHSQVTHYYFADCAYYRPMRTDMALERISIQAVTNIATGQPVRSTYLGTPIRHVGYSYKLYLPNRLLRALIPAGVRQWVRQFTTRA